MDKKIAQNLTLGIFVLVALIGLVFVTFSIGGGSSLFKRQVVYLGKFTDVKGLHYGSEVALNGLNIGTIRNIEVSGNDSKELTVEIAVDDKHRKFVRKDSVAVIKTAGVLGDKYIELSIGSPDQPELENGAPIQTSEPTDILAKGGGLVDDIKRVFDKGGDVEGLLKNLNKLVINLNVVVTDLQKSKGLYRELMQGTSGEKLSKAMAHIESVTGKIDNGEGTLGAIINDPTVYEDLKSVMGGAKRSSVLKYFMNSFIESGKEGTPAPKKK